MKRKYISVCPATLIVGIGLILCGCSYEKNLDQTTHSVLKGLPDMCEIDAGELEFYKELYKKEYGKADKDSVTNEELETFISSYYAEFYLADYYDIGEVFSFKELKAAWMEENASRQEMKENGEVFYGPVEYELTDYFGYSYSNLKLKNIEAIVANADKQLVDACKNYYEENSKQYDDLVGATCLLSDGERTEERVFSYDDIQSLYKTNEAVLNFIIESELGDTMQYPYGDKTVTVELLSKEIDHKEFEELRGVIMNDYVQGEVYDELISKIAENIEFSF